jgi:hypothetical protein
MAQTALNVDILIYLFIDDIKTKIHSEDQEQGYHHKLRLTAHL